MRNFTLCIFTSVLAFAACKKSPNSNNNSSYTDPRDGQVYATVTVNGKQWIAENMRYNAASSRRSSQYPEERYGRLYHRSNYRDACPAGWEVPSAEDYGAFFAYYEGRSNGQTDFIENMRSERGWPSGGNDRWNLYLYPAGTFSERTYQDVFYKLLLHTSSKTMGSTSYSYRNVLMLMTDTDITSVQKDEYADYSASCRCYRDIPAPGAQEPRVTTVANPNPITPDTLVNLWACQPQPQNQPSANDPSVFVDPRDGQRYRTVQLGGKRWFADNIRYAFPTVSGAAPDSDLNNPRLSWGDMSCNPENSNPYYGRLYSFDQQTVQMQGEYPCPSGWHIARESEWNALLQDLGDSAAVKLRAWGNGTNSSGFNALPAGYSLRRPSGPYASTSSLFYNLQGLEALFIARKDTGSSGDYWMTYILSLNNINVSTSSNYTGSSGGSVTDPSYGNSCRCVED